MSLSTSQSREQPVPQSLWNRGFVAATAILFVIFCNMAVFFQFYEYLHRLAVSPRWAGFIIGVFALVALVIRPFISPWLTPFNARRWLDLGTLGVVASLLLYNLALTPWSLMVVRVLHGTAYVVMATAGMAALVAMIPPERSGQAFGIMAVVTLLPYAMLPPLVVAASSHLGSFLRVLNLTALMMLLILPLARLMPLPRADDGSRPPERLRWHDIKEDLSDRRILGLLLASLLVFTAFTPVFYFIKTYAAKLGIANAGWFFTLSTGTEIAVRVVGGRYFDRGSKTRLLGGSLLVLAVSYLGLSLVSGHALFFTLAVGLGLGWGVALPMLNSLMFDLSQPRFRALNANLGLEMFQGGFFLGPSLGAWVLACWSYEALFAACAAACLAALLFLPMIRKGAPAS